MIVNRSLVMVKTISYADKNYLNSKIKDLEQLKKCTYNRIYIPNFSYGVFENVLTIHMQFIKGDQLNEYTKERFKDRIYKDLVCSINPVSATGYTPNNFINGYDGKLYYIDIDDINKKIIKEKKKKFKKDYEFYKTI